MARIFNPSLHPRDQNGRFRKKASVGVRVSTRSVSVTVGRRFPIVPGKANVYVGGLVRLEKASRSKGPIARAADRVQDRLIEAIPEGAARNIIGGVLQEGSYRQGSTLITANSGIRSSPTIRATRSSQPVSRRVQETGQVQTPGLNRSPNRKPRKPRQRRTPTITP